MASQITPETFA